MKLRAKLSGQSRTIDLGVDTNACNVTLGGLKGSVSDAFHLDIRNVDLSLNKKDVLKGEETPLSDHGIVPGDLIHVVTGDCDCPGGIPPIVNLPSLKRKQPIASHGGAANNVVILNCNQNSLPNSDSNTDTAQTPTTAASSQSYLGPSSSHSAQENDVKEMETEDQVMLELVKRSIQEPIVIGESTPSQVPVILTEIYSNFDITCNNDALFVLLHGLMIESGFFPSQNADIASVPSDWKKPGYYLCLYDYVLAPDIVSQCSLMAVPTGASMAVHGLSKTVGDFKTNHLQLKAENYVRDISQDNAAEAFRSLDRLSNLFKDTICLALQNHLATSAGFRETQGLFSLPCEVRMRLMCFLDPKSICNLGETCSQWQAIYKDNSVWRRLYLQSFDRPVDSSLSRNWHEMFRDQYELFKQEQERRRQFLLGFEDDFRLRNLPRPPMGPFHPFDPMPLPRFLGGDHDLHPDFGTGIQNFLPGHGSNPNIRRLPPSHNPFANGGPSRRGRGNMTGSPFFGQGPFM